MNHPIQFLSRETTDRTPLEWGELTWFASRELGNCNTMTTGRCLLRPGASNPRHLHPNCSELLTVISGRIRHTLGPNETVEMGPDDTVCIPPKVWHNATNIGDTDAVLFIAFDSADRETIGE